MRVTIATCVYKMTYDNNNNTMVYTQNVAIKNIEIRIDNVLAYTALRAVLSPDKYFFFI